MVGRPRREQGVVERGEGDGPGEEGAGLAAGGAQVERDAGVTGGGRGGGG